MNEASRPPSPWLNGDPEDVTRVNVMRADLSEAYRLRWSRAIDRKWVEALDSSNPAYTYILNDLEVEFWRYMTYGV